MKKLIILLTVLAVLVSCADKGAENRIQLKPEFIECSSVAVSGTESFNYDNDFMYRSSCPAITGFSEDVAQDSYTDTIYEHSVDVTRTEENGIMKFIGTGDAVSFVIEYNEEEKSFRYIQVLNETVTAWDMPYSYYMVSMADSISFEESRKAWVGDIRTYVFMTDDKENYVFTSTMHGHYHSDEATTGIATFRIDWPSDSSAPITLKKPSLSIEEAKKNIAELTASEPQEYYELVYCAHKTEDYVVYYNESLVGDAEAQKADVINTAKSINPSWIVSY